MIGEALELRLCTKWTTMGGEIWPIPTPEAVRTHAFLGADEQRLSLC